MPMIDLCDGMRAVSNHAHDMATMVAILRGHYAKELTDDERGRLGRFADMLREVRDGCEALATAYTRIPDIDR